MTTERIVAQLGYDVLGVPILYGSLRAEYQRVIRRISVSGPGGTAAIVSMGPLGTTGGFRDGTNSGASDSSEYPNGLEWDAGVEMYVTWTGPNLDKATVQAIANVQYEEYRS